MASATGQSSTTQSQSIIYWQKNLVNGLGIEYIILGWAACNARHSAGALTVAWLCVFTFRGFTRTLLRYFLARCLKTWTLHETRNEVLTGLVNDGCFLGFKVNHLSSVYLAKLRQKNGQVRMVRIENGRLVRSESPCRLSAGLSWVARRRAADWKTYRSTHQKRWELPDGCPALGKKRHFHEGESCQHNQVWANSPVVERGEQSRESFTVHVTFFRLFI